MPSKYKCIIFFFNPIHLICDIYVIIYLLESNSMEKIQVKVEVRVDMYILFGLNYEHSLGFVWIESKFLYGNVPHLEFLNLTRDGHWERVCKHDELRDLVMSNLSFCKLF